MRRRRRASAMWFTVSGLSYSSNASSGMSGWDAGESTGFSLNRRAMRIRVGVAYRLDLKQ